MMPPTPIIAKYKFSSKFPVPAIVEAPRTCPEELLPEELLPLLELPLLDPPFDDPFGVEVASGVFVGVGGAVGIGVAVGFGVSILIFTLLMVTLCELEFESPVWVV